MLSTSFRADLVAALLLATILGVGALALRFLHAGEPGRVLPPEAIESRSTHAPRAGAVAPEESHH